MRLAGGERSYRRFTAGAAKRVPFRVCVATTDLYLRADRDLTAQALTAVRRARAAVEEHIARRPAFATALTPLPAPDDAPAPIVSAMYAAAEAAGVGPMAAVAGAVAGAVGRALRALSREVLVENGGDLYLDLEEDAVVGLLAGTSPFSGRLGLRLSPSQAPLGVCTSSGTVGPSLSYGCADAAVVLAPDPALADAVATAAGNRVHGADDLEPTVDWALRVPGVTGAVAVLGDRLAARGAVEFVELDDRPPGDGRRAELS